MLMSASPTHRPSSRTFSAIPAIPSGIQVAVLEISGMPTALRAVIEDIMVECIATQSCLEIPGADPLEAHWCTRWRRDVVSDAALVAGAGELGSAGCSVGVGCREVLTGTPAEIAALAERVGALADRYGFTARVG